MNDVLKCAFSNWYSIFQDVTIESDIIKLNPEVKSWLLADGIILPKACFHEMDTNFSEDDIEEDVDVPEFPELEASIRQSIRKYRFVFPKLNWSACEDAKWIQACGTKCNTLSEIFLLLKSSDKVVHDLTEAYKQCTDYSAESVPELEYSLVLRKWENINPSMEFRCFVGRNEVIGISQRDVRSYFSHLHRDKDQIISDILDFFRSRIRERFSLDCFVLDLYRPASGSVVLIDVNPFGETTDSLLFDWDELRSKVHAPLPPVFRDFRFIEEQFGVQPNRLEMNSLPLDVFNGNLDPSIFQSNFSNGNSG